MPENTLAILFAAILVESLVNMVRNIKTKTTDWRYWTALALGLVVGVLVSYNWNLDLFSALLGEGQLPYVGDVLTGLVVARGSNVVSDVLKLVNSARARLDTAQPTE